MRIYKDRFYVLESIPGLSGFQRWDEREYGIVTGAKAANERSSVVGEWLPASDEQYRLADGHLPECQPVAHAEGVVSFLRSNPFQAAFAIGRAHERLTARHHLTRTRSA